MYIAGKAFKSSTSSLSILDTGTPFLLTDRNNTAVLYGRILPQITEIDPLGAWGAPCDLIDLIAVDLTFTFSGINVTAPKESFNLGPYKDRKNTCQAVFSSAGPLSKPGQGPFFILDAPPLKQYYTVWDGWHGQIGFSTPC